MSLSVNMKFRRQKDSSPQKEPEANKTDFKVYTLYANSMLLLLDTTADDNYLHLYRSHGITRDDSWC
jgi:hypothetical protein